MAVGPSAGPGIDTLSVSVHTIPTDAPEADGTLEWDSTTLLIVEAGAGGETGLGFSYATRAAAWVIRDILEPVVVGQNATAVAQTQQAMLRSVRNAGRPGIASHVIAAVDIALWDLKSKLLGQSLPVMFGAGAIPLHIYGSGGFTSYSDRTTISQFSDWADQLGCTRFKMKVGADPRRDPQRVRAVRDALPDAELMIDANGACNPRAALALADQISEFGVTWFEEPVSSDDLEGLRLVRQRAPAGMDIAASEYAYDPYYVARMIDAGSVDAIQLDATRICGFSGLLMAAAIAEAHHIPVSAHTAPSLHAAVCGSVAGFRHIEWFHDHARIEQMLFEGSPEPSNGVIAPDLSRPGHGLVLKAREAERFAA